MTNIRKRIHIPHKVKKILDILNRNDYEAYVVGGCVRDSLLNKIPNDWDITTNALPQQVINIFTQNNYKVVETGIKHGTVTVIVEEENFEITTYRIDGDYLDNRRPENVTFTLSLEEDLKRRDFTINAMAFNPMVGIIDNHGGIDDLQLGIIKCVGLANERFNEDALRMMRAIRFACQHEFNIDDDILQSININSNLLRNISVERLRDEFKKILISNQPSSGIRILMDNKLMKYIIPELYECKDFEQHNKHHDKDVLEHTLCVLDNTPPRIEVRIAALLHDIAKPRVFKYGDDGEGHFYKHNIVGANMSKSILKRLKFDNKTIDKVYILIKEHLIMFNNMNNVNIKKFIKRIGQNNLDDLFSLQLADLKGSAKEYNKPEIVFELQKRCNQILEQKLPLELKDLNINGKDLIELGINDGRVIGRILNALLDDVLTEPSLNTHEKLINEVKKRYL